MLQSTQTVWTDTRWQCLNHRLHGEHDANSKQSSPDGQVTDMQHQHPQGSRDAN